MTTHSDHWLRVRLDDVKAHKRYAINGGPFGSKLVSRDYTAHGVPVIRGANLPEHNRFSFQDFVFVSEEKADQLFPNNAHPVTLSSLNEERWAKLVRFR